MKIGSLFSGIGGLELGLEWSGLGHTVWQVEQSDFCRRVLAKHWPDVERFDDVKTVGAANLSPVDVICGGFPCQDISTAGHGRDGPAGWFGFAKKSIGLAGSRSGLWFEFARVINELKPRWVVVENVASGANKWVDHIVAGLGELGYQALPIPLSAQDVGAPHRRARVFVVAHAGCRGFESSLESQIQGQQGTRWCESNGCDCSQKEYPGGPAWPQDETGSFVRPVRGMDGGSMSRLDRFRIAALGNAVVPQCSEVIGYLIQELEARMG